MNNGEFYVAYYWIWLGIYEIWSFDLFANSLEELDICTLRQGVVYPSLGNLGWKADDNEDFKVCYIDLATADDNLFYREVIKA